MKFILLLLFSFLSIQSIAQDAKIYIHPRAQLYTPQLMAEVDKYMPEEKFPEPAYSFALTEHETCIHFKHIFCWNPRAELKNDREQGVGVGQLTRTWNKDGSVRFDNLANMKKSYYAELYEATWENFKLRPDLQFRIMALMVRDGYLRYKAIKDPYTRYHFTDIDYNGGGRDLLKARQACNLSKGCDSQIWFDHVERFNPKPNTPDKRYGGRSLRQINNHHARDVFFTRLPKFQNHIKEYRRDQQSRGTQALAGAT